MKAMIWKEWRENLKWGVLAFLSLSLAFLSMSLTIITTTKQGFDPRGALPPNLFETTAPLTEFLVPIFAGVLGIVQVGSELRRDQWAFLLHRPVSRSVLFGGKAVAGLSLYFAATGTPLLLLALWMQTPGAIAAPFDWRLILAPLANILAGVAWYFAGMLVAVRPARWYGSRAVGFALAIGVLLWMNVANEFYQAVLVAVFGAATLGLAAWGSFLTSGTYHRQPKLAQIGLGVTLFLSTAMILGCATAFVTNAVARGQRDSLYASRKHVQSHNYSIDATGRILLFSFDERGNMFATDLQGRRVAKQPSDGSQSGRPSLLARNSLFEGWTDDERESYRSTDRYYLRLSRSASASDASPLWFWMQSEKRLVAFSPISKRRIGSMGPQGFVPIESGVAAPFAEPLRPLASRVGSDWPDFSNSHKTQILSFAHALFFCNLAEKRVTRFYNASSEQPIRGVSGLQPYVGELEGGVAVVDQNLIRVYGKNARPLFSTPVEAQKEARFSLSISALPKNDRFFLWYELQVPPMQQSQIHISEISERGAPLANHQLPALHEESVPFQSFWYEKAAPIAETPAIVLGALTIMEQREVQKYPWNASDALIHRANETRNQFLTSLLLGALYAALTFLVAKRADLAPRARVGWAFSGFALGLFGLLLLLSLHEWPLLLPCAACGKKRGLSRENCEHCGAPFPDPPVDETAIFDDPVTAADAADWNRIREVV